MTATTVEPNADRVAAESIADSLTAIIEATLDHPDLSDRERRDALSETRTYLIAYTDKVENSR